LREQQQLLQNCVMLSLKRIQKYGYFDKKQEEMEKKLKKICSPVLIRNKNSAAEESYESMVLVFNAYLISAGCFTPM